MIKLIPKEERKEALIKFGAPRVFIENIGKIEELKFRVEEVKGAYFYFPTIKEYQILRGLNIIPIYDEGETFRVFGYNDNTRKIFHFELENDEVYTDYGSNWDLLLQDIMFEFHNDEMYDGLNLETYKKVGKQLGFKHAEHLFRLLEISDEEYDRKYNELSTWRVEIARELGIRLQ